MQPVKPSFFVVHEQGTPKPPTSSIHYNNYISTNGEKLEACLKIIECPVDTSSAMVKDSYTR
jgi:hypothetical protein